MPSYNDHLLEEINAVRLANRIDLWRAVGTVASKGSSLMPSQKKMEGKPPKPPGDLTKRC